jgi:hypothetical protein
MNLETLKETIRQELPELLRRDPDFRSYILEITRGEFADRKETRDWVHETLDEMRREREKQDKKWGLRQERWEAQVRRNREEFYRIHEEIMAIAQKHDRSIGALGARWVMQSERSFRNTQAGILEQNFGVEVFNVNDYDEQGVVFGRPDQIELDVIIKNESLLICELKSSIDKAGLHIFERKARFYESRHNRKADRLIVISPMIDPQAQKLAERLNIETYGYPEEVKSLDEVLEPSMVS